MFQLYLDESQTRQGGNSAICLAGIVIQAEDHDKQLIPQLDTLKSKIWADQPDPTSIVLHEKDVRAYANNRPNRDLSLAPYYSRFRKGSVTKALYRELNKIFSSLPITIIGACLDEVSSRRLYSSNFRQDLYLATFQIVLENYVHFLESQGERGVIFWESRSESQDQLVRMRYHQVKAMGTLYANAHIVQAYLRDIEFPRKSDNVAGLQLADFVPNPFARNVLKLGVFKPNIYKTLRTLRYDGNCGLPKRFGVKVVP